MRREIGTQQNAQILTSRPDFKNMTHIKITIKSISKVHYEG